MKNSRRARQRTPENSKPGEEVWRLTNEQGRIVDVRAPDASRAGLQREQSTPHRPSFSAIIQRLSRVSSWFVVVLALSAQPGAPLERFTATALSRTDATVRTLVEIDIQRWSDDAEREQLAAAFRRSGVDAALQELTRHPVAGQLRSITGLTQTIRYARESGRRSALVTCSY
jgi:hypothetical protein